MARTDAEKLRQAREARQLDTGERSGPGLACGVDKKYLFDGCWQGTLPYNI